MEPFEAEERLLRLRQLVLGDDRQRIEEALTESIRKDPERLANVVFPIIGPAIRRSIRQALADLAQRLNQSIEHSLTLRGLAMRLEAARSGVPFAEIVLRRSLVYRVEQLFLIHRESGLLLAKAVDENIATHDPDLVSSMLTVVQGFVRDSLKVQEGDALESMRVGDLSIWVEPGPHAIMAAVIRGTPPQQLRGELSDLLAELHAEYRSELDAFDGDLGPFHQVPQRMATGLATQESSKKPGRTLTFAILLSALAVLVLGIVGSRYSEGRKIDRLVAALDREPGIAVLETSREQGRFVVRGLRDPLAVDPGQVMADLGLDTAPVGFRWESFVAGDPGLVIQRLRRTMEVPSGVALSASGLTIEVRGASSRSWLSDLRERLALVAPHIELELSGWAEQ